MPFKVIPAYKDRSFLHENYVEKGLSLKQISAQIASSKSTILKALKEFGIPLREAHSPHGRTAQVLFGYRKSQGKVTTYIREQKTIEAILGMREQGLGLRATARVLTKMQVPTKRKGLRWHPTMVERILKSQKQPITKEGNQHGSYSNFVGIESWVS